jgi:hypothetical protein
MFLLGELMCLVVKQAGKHFSDNESRRFLSTTVFCEERCQRQLTAIVSPAQVRDNGLVQPEIIAERAYYLGGEPESPVILLQLLRPDQPENAYPRCRYRLVVGGKTEESEVSSVDSIDCIALCLAVAGSKIAGLNEAVYENKLRWEGSSGDGDIGLPTIEDSPLTKQAYQEAQRWLSEQKPGAQDGPET